MASQPIPGSTLMASVDGEIWGEGGGPDTPTGYGEVIALITGDERQEASGEIDIFFPGATDWEDGDLLTLEMEDGRRVELIFHKCKPPESGGVTG